VDDLDPVNVGWVTQKSVRTRARALQSGGPPVADPITAVPEPYVAKASEVNALAAIDSIERELADQRSSLRQVWKTQAARVEDAEERLRAVAGTLTQGSWALHDVLGKNRAFSYAPSPVSVNGEDHTSMLVRNEFGSWVVDSSIVARLESLLGQALSEIHRAERPLRGQRARDRATDLLDEYRQILAVLVGAREQVQQHRDRATEARAREASAARSKSQVSMDSVVTEAERVLQRLPPALQPWSSAIWQDDWTRFRSIVWPAQMYVGRLTATPDADLGDNVDFGMSESIPLIISPSESLQLLHAPARSHETLGLVRSLLLRSVVALEPGGLEFCFFDPMERGSSVAGPLARPAIDPGGNVWSSESELSELLADQLAHMARVAKKHLGSTFSTIDDRNLAAGEIVEPYRVLVILDYPTGFNEELCAQLQRVVDVGPRCGIRTIVASNLGVPLPVGVTLALPSTRMHQIVMEEPFSLRHNGYALAMSFRPDSDLGVGDSFLKDIVPAPGL
jgi:hypothetical protein